MGQRPCAVLQITEARSASRGASLVIPGLYDGVLIDADGFLRAELFDLTRTQAAIVASEWNAVVEEAS